MNVSYLYKTDSNCVTGKVGTDGFLDLLASQVIYLSGSKPVRKHDKTSLKYQGEGTQGRKPEEDL